MLERLKFWRTNEAKQALTLEEVNRLSPEHAKAYFEAGRPVVVENDKEGDGKAEFIGEGSHEEFEAMEREDKGIKGIFGLK